jgi:hypothetical protein
VVVQAQEETPIVTPPPSPLPVDGEGEQTADVVDDADVMTSEENAPQQVIVLPPNERNPDIVTEQDLLNALVGSMGAQAVDLPPVDDDGQLQLILLVMTGVFVVFSAVIALLGERLYRSLPPTLQDTFEYSIKRMAEDAATRAEKTPATWDDELAQTIREQVEAWFEEWRMTTNGAAGDLLEKKDSPSSG